MYARIRPIGTLTAALLLTACAAQETLVSSPTVNLNQVQMSRLSFSGQTFLLRFDVSNPNPFPLPVTCVRYSVRLGEYRFASGETRGEFSVPAAGDGSFTISVDLDMLQQSPQLSSLLMRGVRDGIDYELRGSLDLDIPFTKPIPFSSSGAIRVANDL